MIKEKDYLQEIYYFFPFCFFSLVQSETLEMICYNVSHRNFLSV
jgi:hypothetical protein